MTASPDPRPDGGPGEAEGRDLEAGAGPWGKRLAWFAGLWLASIAGLGVVAYAIRWAIMP